MAQSNAMEKVGGLTVKKVRGEERYEVMFDCPTCGGRQMRMTQTKDPAVLVNVVNDCYACHEAKKPVDQKIRERAQWLWDEVLGHRRSRIRGELEASIRAAQRELDMMDKNREFVPLVGSMVNWVLVDAERASEEAKQCDEIIAQIKQLIELAPEAAKQGRADALAAVVKRDERQAAEAAAAAAAKATA